MEDEDGGLQWSRDHNAHFEISKLAIMHCGWKKKKQPNGTLVPLLHPTLVLQGKLITEVDSYKYQGVYINNKLSWRTHKNYMIEKATKWVQQCH